MLIPIVYRQSEIQNTTTPACSSWVLPSGLHLELVSGPNVKYSRSNASEACAACPRVPVSLKEQYGWWGKWRRRSWKVASCEPKSCPRAALEGLCQLCHRAMQHSMWHYYVQDGPGLWEAAAHWVSTTFFNRAFIITLTTLSRDAWTSKDERAPKTADFGRKLTGFLRSWMAIGMDLGFAPVMDKHIQKPKQTQVSVSYLSGWWPIN
jgi:hypothetical protein